MAINSISVIKDTVLLFRDFISGTVTDPVSDRQKQSADPGSNARFVMTSWPSRPVVYPCITISDVAINDYNLGMQTEDSYSIIQMQVDVWSKQVGQRDGIAGSVFHGLRTSQLGNGGLIASGLQDFRLVSSRNIDEPGKTGIHRKTMLFEVSYINTT